MIQKQDDWSCRQSNQEADVQRDFQQVMSSWEGTWGVIGSRGKAMLLNQRLLLCWCFIIQSPRNSQQTDQEQVECSFNAKASISGTGSRLWDVSHQQMRLRWTIQPAAIFNDSSRRRRDPHVQQAVGKNVPEDGTEHKQGVDAEKYPEQGLLLKPLLVVLQDHHPQGQAHQDPPQVSYKAGVGAGGQGWRVEPQPHSAAKLYAHCRRTETVSRLKYNVWQKRSFSSQKHFINIRTTYSLRLYL